MSFVSVTQQFNTTTSMGRLTLNVLLSFAQFEREVLQAIRDKIAASKRKGLWVGGMAPLGYETKDRRVIAVEEEAERVRTIFRSYLALGSLNRVLADLRQRGIVTKLRTLKTGRTVGAIPFTRGPLAYVKQCLVPTLKRGEIVLMDNLPVHKVAGVAEAIEGRARRRTIFPILAYLNPIELAFTNSRQICARRQSVQFPTSWQDRPPSRRFRPMDAVNFFRHAAMLEHDRNPL